MTLPSITMERCRFFGRLFAQWLHYAYPRECSFPHVSGTIEPIRSWERDGENITEPRCDRDCQEGIIATSSPSKKRVPGAIELAEEESGMWVQHEELVVWQDSSHHHSFSSDLTSVRAIAWAGAILSILVAAVRSLNRGQKCLHKASVDKYCVYTLPMLWHRGR